VVPGDSSSIDKPTRGKKRAATLPNAPSEGEDGPRSRTRQKKTQVTKESDKKEEASLGKG